MIHTEIYDVDGSILKAGGIIVNSDHQVLLYKGENTGFSFPKGHMEKGETTEENAKREVFEETGLYVEIQKELPNLEYFNTFVKKNVRVKMFLMKSIAGKLTLENDTDELVWLSYEDAIKKLDPSNRGQFLDLQKYLMKLRDEIV